MNDIILLIRRSLINTLRTPAATIPNIAISIFFLFVFSAGLSDLSNLPGFTGSYLAFILPVSIVSAAVGGAGAAGQALISDIESGYFTKLLLTPARRLAIIWGPMMAGAIVLVVQVIIIIGLGFALGLKSATGFPGLILVVLLAFIWGMAFAGYSVFFALRTKNAAAAQAATFAFFPLLFLSTTFVPKEFITVHWLKVAATLNPTTYVYDAMRSLLIHGWQTRPLLLGFTVMLAFSTLTGALALIQAKRTTQLKS
jgi:ABC-2 type transport system permease protein